jgi:nifR3 family TIM-barrel protein
MKDNFWNKIKKPFFCLAPMSDVTDVAFRAILAKYGKNKNNEGQIVFWTEFVSADGLCHKIGKKKLKHILQFSKIEKPIIAQVFGANPVNMEKACRIISKLGFAGIDINMGCPDKSVIKQGAGSALIRTPELAREIIQATIRGANGLPISVKTRVGFNKEEIDIWIPELLKEDISALTIHARTKKEMSKVSANWDYVKRVVELVKKSGKKILVIGNGDVKSLAEAREKINKYNCDGVMIGRGVFGKPDFFAEQKPGLGYSQSPAFVPTLKEKIKALVEHIKIFDKKLLKTGDKSYSVMKKHFKAYLNGFSGAQDLRNKLMLTEAPKQAITILIDFQKTIK